MRMTAWELEQNSIPEHLERNVILISRRRRIGFVMCRSRGSLLLLSLRVINKLYTQPRKNHLPLHLQYNLVLATGQ